MAFLQGTVNVDGEQQGEDVGLQDLDQDLQEVDEDAQKQCASTTEDAADATDISDQEAQEGGSNHDGHVTREHGGEHTQRVGDRTDDQVGDELDRDQEEVEQLGNVRRHGHLGHEVPKTMTLDADTDPGNVSNDGQDVGRAGVGQRGQLQNGDGPEQVVDQDEEEEAEQQRQPGPELLLTDDVAAQGVAHESVANFTQVLSFGRNQRLLANGPHEEAHDQNDRQEDQHRVLGEFEGADLEERREVHVRNAGSLEALSLTNWGDDQWRSFLLPSTQSWSKPRSWASAGQFRASLPASEPSWVFSPACRWR